MTKTARAAVYDEPNTPFVIREYPVRDVKPDEALVRITMSTIRTWRPSGKCRLNELGEGRVGIGQ